MSIAGVIVPGVGFFRLPEDAEALAKARGGVKPSRRKATAMYSEKRRHTSLSMGCHRKDAVKLMREIKRRGIQGVTYVPDRHGYRCQMTSARGAAQWEKAYGEIHGIQDLHNAGNEGVNDG